MNTKRVEDLTVEDIETAPVWQFTNSDGPQGETVVRALKKVPVKNLKGKIVGTSVLLANGSSVWALLGNVVSDNSKLTQHFLTLSVERNGKWFTMARYHDFDAIEHGPHALADFLGLAVDDVFPIVFDISAFSQGKHDALAGTIEKEPKERMTRREIIRLALEE